MGNIGAWGVPPRVQEHKGQAQLWEKGANTLVQQPLVGGRPLPLMKANACPHLGGQQASKGITFWGSAGTILQGETGASTRGEVL